MTLLVGNILAIYGFIRMQKHGSDSHWTFPVCAILGVCCSLVGAMIILIDFIF